MLNPSAQAFSPRAIATALVIGSVGLIILGVQPILLGALLDQHLISLDDVGVVAMGEIITLGLGVAIGDMALPISHHKLITALAALVAAGFDVGTLFASNFAGFALTRMADGFAEGVLLWVATNTIVRTAKPDRLVAVFMVVQTLAQSGMAALLASVVVPHGGWRGGFAALGAVSLLTAAAAFWLPPRLAPLHSHETPKLRWSPATILPLPIAFLEMAALGSMWAYLEPLGLAVGLSEQGAQSVVSLVLVMQVLGGLTAIWAVRRSPVAVTLALGAAVLAAIAVGVHFTPAGAFVSFTLLFAVFGFAWLFLMPFQVALALRADPPGRVAVLIPAAQLIGSAIGPLGASLVVNGDDASPVPFASLAFSLVAIVLTVAGRRLWQNA